MTREEADRELMYLKSKTGQEKTLEAIEMARHLLTKTDEPRMVRYESDGFADGLPVYDAAYCPNCEHDFYMDEAAVWEMPYCPNCGQALRWEGDEHDDNNNSFDNGGSSVRDHGVHDNLAH